MTTIKYMVGDATNPYGDGPKVIAHVCNDVGAWGSGFVMALSARWSEPEKDYRDWHRQHVEGWAGAAFELGHTRFARCAPNPNGIVVANMIAQRGVRHHAAQSRAVSYTALGRCLDYVGNVALADGDSVHLPRIGCGLAGGTWDRVEPLIQRYLCDVGVDVTVYDLPGTTGTD